MASKKFCPQCGNEVKITAKFCPHCGADLSKVQVSQTAADEPKRRQTTTASKTVKAPKRPMKKKTKVIIAVVAVLAVLFIGFYTWGNNHYSRENQINQIMVNLKNPQMGLAAYVTTDDRSMKVTDSSLKPLQKYYQEHQTAANTLGSDLKNGSSSPQISLVESGRYWLFFPKYTIQLNTYTPQVKTNHENSTVLVNGKSIGKLSGDNTDYYCKLKPLFPGKYHIEVKSPVAGRSLNADATVNVWSNKTVNLDIETATFSVNSIPKGTIYINDKSVGTLDKDGRKTFKDYPITANMELYVTTSFGKKIVKSEPVTGISAAFENNSNDYDSDDDTDVISNDGNKFVISPQWSGLVAKDDAEDMLESNFRDPDSDSFVGGAGNASYQELHKMDKAWDNDDKMNSYDMDCDIVSVGPASADSSSVVYKIKYEFDYSDGSEKKQVMLYHGAVFQKIGNNQKIKSIGNGKIISSKTIAADNDD
ncbi:zinc-ribbon domain-containing protein [Lactobacillus sp. ESL0791]|uniref:zinc ribbon domain-containing protein n=1 Tax=Lactobacillus sp. ESL0791 TaxID=2983234 RepID=UPI0023F89661|nr:zinc-ribbon domain-containing protein [Lactobacillus sp. ESL0791]MDF7639544.1 zinc-ribbon domain-containing protein [Lactobacillus sp. ESL0791]